MKRAGSYFFYFFDSWGFHGLVYLNSKGIGGEKHTFNIPKKEWQICHFVSFRAICITAEMLGEFKCLFIFLFGKRSVFVWLCGSRLWITYKKRKKKKRQIENMWVKIIYSLCLVL